jgi:exosortase
MKEFEMNGIAEKVGIGLLRPLLIQGGVLVALLIVMYFSEIKDLVFLWLDKKEYSHGFLIPLISGYVIWLKRTELGKVTANPDIKGLFLFLSGIALLIMGNVAFEPYIRQFSLVITILGIIYFLLGSEFFKMLLFPVGYLIFMIPIPYIIMNTIAVNLRLVDAKITYHFLHFMGIPIMRDGAKLELPNISLLVADLCTGILSIIALLALAVFYAYLTQRTNLARTALIFIAIPVSIIGNMIRLIATVWLAYYFGHAVLEGVIHQFHGTVNFLITVGLLVLCGSFIKRIDLKIAGEKRHDQI